jgi:hypothetical protein
MDNTNQAVTSRQAAIDSFPQDVGTVTTADPETAGSLAVTDWSVRSVSGQPGPACMLPSLRRFSP